MSRSHATRKEKHLTEIASSDLKNTDSPQKYYIAVIPLKHSGSSDRPTPNRFPTNFFAPKFASGSGFTGADLESEKAPPPSRGNKKQKLNITADSELSAAAHQRAPSEHKDAYNAVGA